MVDVFEFLLGDGTSFGCGTRVEFEYWMAQGIYDASSTLGRVIAQEPASEDDRRKAAWGI